MPIAYTHLHDIHRKGVWISVDACIANEYGNLRRHKSMIKAILVSTLGISLLSATVAYAAEAPPAQPTAVCSGYAGEGTNFWIILEIGPETSRLATGSDPSIWKQSRIGPNVPSRSSQQSLAPGVTLVSPKGTSMLVTSMTGNSLSLSFRNTATVGDGAEKTTELPCTGTLPGIGMTTGPKASSLGK